MKNKKGFISISIIYSFFIVFLLLLALIMSTYINNRYSFNIFTKDEKRYHADQNSVIPNQTSAIAYSDSNANFYSYYYYRTNAEGTEKYDYTNFYYYNETATITDLTNKTFNIYIVLGPYEDHNLNYTSFFTTSLMRSALRESGVNKSNKIIIAPSLNSEYVTWTESLSSAEGIKDINERLINALGTQITSTTSTDPFITQCSNATNCVINMKLIGYKDGANGVIKYMGNTTSNPVGINKVNYAVMDSSIICNTSKCDELTATERTNILTKLNASPQQTVLLSASGRTSTDETLKYYEKMENLYMIITGNNPGTRLVAYDQLGYTPAQGVSGYITAIIYP